ncbi:MAG TPA: hypothetical protein VM845_01770 [Burkholderiaceae bacterium]|nr:hypothetical protein [Burkholderiaceae bacterium]
MAAEHPAPAVAPQARPAFDEPLELGCSPPQAVWSTLLLAFFGGWALFLLPLGLLTDQQELRQRVVQMNQHNPQGWSGSL